MHEATTSCEPDDVERVSKAPPRALPEFLLVRETHHRLMNSFALMDAYLRRESRGASGTLPATAVVRFAEMIYAQGELHRCLALQQTIEPIRLDDYLIRLCRCLSGAVLRPFGVVCKVTADAGYLPAWQCERLGLITTELVVNAAKHAFPERSSGTIRVELRHSGDKWHCVVADNGSGFEAAGLPWSDGTPAKEASVGSQIVDTLVRSLEGTKVVRVTPVGTIVAITFPAASLATEKRRG